MNLDSVTTYEPPREVIRIQTIDAHTGGEPLRVIVGGWPALKGNTVLERRRYCLRHFDHLRRAIMLEPRGHADMYGCLVMPAVTDEADFSVLFMHNEGYSTMCGHGIIAVTKVAVELGIVDSRSRITQDGSHTEGVGRADKASFPGALSVDRSDNDAAPDGDCPIGIDSPAGLIRATAHLRGGIVENVSFANVPSFVDSLDAEVDVPGLGRVKYDLAFGGAYYAYVDASEVGVTMDASGYRDLIAKGVAIKRAVMESRQIEHPTEPDLGFLYGTIFVGGPLNPLNHSRNVCVFADGEVDRSPTGTGVSGRVAIMSARGQLDDESVTIESILGTTFSVRVANKSRLGKFDTVTPVVTGSASLTGRTEQWISCADPLREGFMLR